MATIFAVHGTNATGPEEGDYWWQRTSQFEAELRRLIAAKDGELRFVPMTWTGMNSETSRFEAGEKLRHLLHEEERAPRHYCIVAHSHGGSAAAHALISAIFERQPLEHMSRWITVGTPFVDLRKRMLLFSRLNAFGVAAFFILVYLVLMYGAFVASLIYKGFANRGVDIVLLIAGLVVLGIIYAVVRTFQPRKLRSHYARLAKKAGEHVRTRWVPLWHANDEAIQGLKILGTARVIPFDKYFAVPTFSFASLVLFPLIVLALSPYGDFNQLAAHIKSWEPIFEPVKDPDPFKIIARNNFAIVTYPAIFMFRALDFLGVHRHDVAWLDRTILGIVLGLGALIGFAAIWLLSVVAHRAVISASRVLSHGIAIVLNHFTHLELRRLGFGVDTIGETGVGALEHPSWLMSRLVPLPKKLSDEISAISNAAASESLTRLRTALGTLAFSEQGNTVGQVIFDYLSWRELIHTSYFHAPRLRKLVAFAISESQGFEATEEFRRDPDYPVLAEWLAEIKRGIPTPTA